MRRIFYQGDPSRISACPVTIHSLLHIADGIKAAGPVWATWAFVMERYCGFIKRRAVRSRAHPYASINRRIVEMAQLNVILMKYGLRKKLTLKAKRGRVKKDRFSECMVHSIPFVCNGCQFVLNRPTIYTTSPKKEAQHQ